MKPFLRLVLLLIAIPVVGQTNNFTSKIYETYNNYKEPSLEKRRIKHNDIQPLINRLKNKKAFTLKKVGTSIEGRDLTLISARHRKNECVFMVSNAW